MCVKGRGEDEERKYTAVSGSLVRLYTTTPVCSMPPGIENVHIARP